MNQQNTEFQLIDDQIEDKNSVILFENQAMFKIGDFMKELNNSFFIYGLKELYNRLQSKGGIPAVNDHKPWINGLKCELLKQNKGWKKGKIRLKISLEFCPDEPEIKQPESPLDEIRKTL